MPLHCILPFSTAAPRQGRPRRLEAYRTSIGHALETAGTAIGECFGAGVGARPGSPGASWQTSGRLSWPPRSAIRPRIPRRRPSAREMRPGRALRGANVSVLGLVACVCATMGSHCPNQANLGFLENVGEARGAKPAAATLATAARANAASSGCSVLCRILCCSLLSLFPKQTVDF